MRTYYRGRDAVVTSELFVRRITSTKSYAIRDLRNVCIASDQHGGRSRPAAAAGIAFLGLAGALVALAAGSVGTLILLGPATTLAVAGTLLWPRRPANWELRASYRGRTISLYSSCDVTVFNQVARALRRAIEAERRPRLFEDGRRRLTVTNQVPRNLQHGTLKRGDLVGSHAVLSA
jgi:hypothetical protein